ncbi:MAG: hypothetical protein A2Y67_03265 [Candidatus Buchananbacteria bacterium RBG_13_39_9]|uniref:Uncharacterized protein n=1 Tax=Candidatus Buchananbacteria bacterium RBG_13_39_9 TaxID=1797531 RepID=A0A1G1XR87_9BACT|nr:MAG: hypothetical protein A2Y67_03265 [Candidatus Buchananbacteria bacterium RBG_13_39_9]
MTERAVTDEQLGHFSRRVHDLQTRVEKGAVDFSQVMDGLQLLNEGKAIRKEKDVQVMIHEWREIYREDGIEADFSNLWIPAYKKGFDRLIVIPKGLKIQQVYDNCAKLFPCLKNFILFPRPNSGDINLDKLVTNNDRDPANGGYAIWLRDRIEADKELKSLSANDLEKKKISGITLLERLLYELKYYKETGEHLDVKNHTLCSGSRDSIGNPAIVGLCATGGCIALGNSVNSHVTLRVRSVVS